MSVAVKSKAIAIGTLQPLLAIQGGDDANAITVHSGCKAILEDLKSMLG